MRLIYTANPSIIKIEAPEVLFKGSYEYTNVQEAQAAPLAQELLALPFVKTVFFSANFIALEALPDVNWQEVASQVLGQVEAYLAQGKPLVAERKALAPEEDTEQEASPTTVPVLATAKPYRGLPKLGDTYARKITAVLNQYVIPVLLAQGEQLTFLGYDRTTQEVTLRFTPADGDTTASFASLKNPIEKILRQHLGSEKIIVKN